MLHLLFYRVPGFASGKIILTIIWLVSPKTFLKQSIFFFLTKDPLADDSSSTVFSLYVNIIFKRVVVTILGRKVRKKCMKFVCGVFENVYDNARLFWDFRYLKINCNLSVKSKLNGKRLSGKLPKNTRHPMVETSERLFLMRLLQWNFKSSCPEVFCK